MLQHLVISGFRRGTNEILLFWHVTQRIAVVRCLRFRTTHLQLPRSAWHFEGGPIVCPETSATNYCYSLRNISEERRSHYSSCYKSECSIPEREDTLIFSTALRPAFGLTRPYIQWGIRRAGREVKRSPPYSTELHNLLAFTQSNTNLSLLHWMNILWFQQILV